MKRIDIKTDVLVIGGGLAGCMAAIRASELGVKVALVEKGNTLRSGQAGSGIDHVWAYIPPVHEPMGWSMDDLVEDHFQVSGNSFAMRGLIRLIARESYHRVLDLERFGLKIRFEDSVLPGKFRVVPQFHSVPSSFHFEGREIKPKLAQEVKRRKVNIINRAMVTDLLTDKGHLVGAVGVSTRQPRWYTFQAKAVVLATGRASRLTRNVTSVPFNIRISPSGTGEGKAMAFRAGLELINMEFLFPHRLCIGGWQVGMGAPRGSLQPAGALVDKEGNVIIPRMHFLDWSQLGKYKVDPQKERENYLLRRRQERVPLLKMYKEGKGPFYLDCTQGTEEEIEYIKWAISHEGHGFLFCRYLDEHGIDLRKDKIEFGLLDRELAGSSAAGILVDENCATPIAGLFAAGDEVGGVPWSSAPGALAMGWHAGEMAAKYGIKENYYGKPEGEAAENLASLYQDILSRKKGDSWQEVETALQSIVDYYAGEVRAEGMLRAGLTRLQELKESARLKAENPHELRRCLEVRSLMDNAEMVISSSLGRRESRPACGFHRSDFPEQDDKNWFTFLAIRKDGEDVKFSKVPIR